MTLVSMQRGPPPPACRAMGTHCTALRVVLRVSSQDDGPTSGDHEATWLLGHTERIEFGRFWRRGGELFTEAVLRGPCRYLGWQGEGHASCRAHGYSTILPAQAVRAPPPQPRRLGDDRFRIVERGRPVTRLLPPPASPSRELPLPAGPAGAAPPPPPRPLGSRRFRVRRAGRPGAPPPPPPGEPPRGAADPR